MLNIIIFAVLAATASATGDAIKFSGIKQTKLLDWLWHAIKYFIVTPSVMLTGYFFITYWIENDLWDIWHYKKNHFYLLGVFVLCLIIWQLTYNIMLRVLV